MISQSEVDRLKQEKLWSRVTGGPMLPPTHQVLFDHSQHTVAL